MRFYFRRGRLRCARMARFSGDIARDTVAGRAGFETQREKKTNVLDEPGGIAGLALR